MNHVEKKAYELLLTNHIHALPVDTIRLAKRLGYAISSYDASKDLLASFKLIDYIHRYESFSVYIHPHVHIFYSDTLSPTQIRHRVAHEIGHIQFDFSDNTSESPAPRLISTTEESSESLANEFERYLTAPIPALDMCNISSAADIQSLTGYGTSDARLIYSNLQEYRQSKSDMEDKQKIGRLFRRFGLRRWFYAHRVGLVISALSVIVTVLASLLVLDRFAPSTAPANLPLNASQVSSEPIPALSSSQDASPKETSASEPQEATVYITPSGEKYHRSGCQYIEDKSNLTELSESRAAELGYEPCKVCCQ